MKKNAKKLICLILALVLSLALAIPALAAGTPLLPEKGGSMTMTLEIPDISYTLTVPSSCSIDFAGEDVFRPIGSVTVTKAERFTEINYVDLKVTHDVFSSQTTSKQLSYQLGACAVYNDAELWVNIDAGKFNSDPGNNWMRFYPEANYPSGSASYQGGGGSITTAYIRSKDTIPFGIKLGDMSTLDAGTYTSTITFTANLY